MIFVVDTLGVLQEQDKHMRRDWHLLVALTRIACRLIPTGEVAWLQI